MAKPRLAGVINLTRLPTYYSLTVDGEEFPFVITGLEYNAAGNKGIPEVVIRVPADRVEIIDSDLGGSCAVRA